MRRFVLFVFVLKLILLVACNASVNEAVDVLPQTDLTRTSTIITRSLEPAVPTPSTQSTLSPTLSPVPTPTVISTFEIDNEACLLSSEAPVFIQESLGVDECTYAIFASDEGWVAREILLPGLAPYIKPSYLAETGNAFYMALFPEGVSLESFDFTSGEQTTRMNVNVNYGVLLPNRSDFVYLTQDDLPRLYLHDEVSGFDQLLTDDVSRYFSASPDGQKIAFERPRTDPGLYVMDLDSGEETKLMSWQRDSYAYSISEYEYPMWSQTGEQILTLIPYMFEDADNNPDRGIFWGASDGSFAHYFSQEQLHAALNDNVTKGRDETLCLVRQPLFDDNIMVDMAASCETENSYGAHFDSYRQRTHIVIFHFNAANGEIETVAAIPYPGRYRLTTWETPGEAVLVLHEDLRVEPVSLNPELAPAVDLVTCQPIGVNQPHLPAFIFVHQGELHWGAHSYNQPFTQFGDVVSAKAGPDFVAAFARQPNDETIEVWLTGEIETDFLKATTISIPEYVASAPESVVGASVAYEWIPDSKKLFIQIEPEMNAIGRLPLQQPTIFDWGSEQTIELDSYGESFQAAFADGGHLAALILAGEIQLIDLDTGEILYQIPAETSKPHDQTISFSDNGRFIAMFEPNNLLIIDTTSGDVQRVPLEFTDVGLGHQAAWPPIHWLHDDTTIRTLLTQTETPFVPEATFTVWDIDAETAVAVPREAYTGNILKAEFAPDANYLAYLMPNAGDQNRRKLMIANIFQGTEMEYAQGKLLEFGGWNPDGAHFTYKGESEMLQLGHICQAPQPLLDATDVQWIDDQRFVTIIGDEANQAKNSGVWDVSAHTIGDLESEDTLYSNFVMQIVGPYPEAIVVR